MTGSAARTDESAGHATAPQQATAAELAAMSHAVAESLRACQRLVRRHLRDRWWALRLTPEPKRSALCCLYAFNHRCRALADRQDAPREAALERIERFRHDLRQTVQRSAGDPLPPGTLWPALRYVTEAYSLDPLGLHSLLDGHRRDLLTDQYERFDDLYAHCRDTGGAVQRLCLPIFGHDGDAGVPQLAEYRGVALQLTGLLRDQAADAGRGRVMVPAEDLTRFGCTPQQLRMAEADANLERLIVFQGERAHSYFEMSASLERHLNAACRPASWAMMQMHRELLERIAASPRRVLTGRVRAGWLCRARLTARAAWRGYFDQG